MSLNIQTQTSHDCKRFYLGCFGQNLAPLYNIVSPDLVRQIWKSNLVGLFSDFLDLFLPSQTSQLPVFYSHFLIKFLWLLFRKREHRWHKIQYSKLILVVSYLLLAGFFWISCWLFMRLEGVLYNSSPLATLLLRHRASPSEWKQQTLVLLPI